MQNIKRATRCINADHSLRDLRNIIAKFTGGTCGLERDAAQRSCCSRQQNMCRDGSPSDVQPSVEQEDPNY